MIKLINAIRSNQVYRENNLNTRSKATKTIELLKLRRKKKIEHLPKRETRMTMKPV